MKISQITESLKNALTSKKITSIMLAIAIIAIMIATIHIPTAKALISTSAIIKNSPTKADNLKTYSIYESFDDKHYENNFTLCKNLLSRKIYFDMNITDLNTIEQIDRFGNVSFKLIANEQLKRTISFGALTKISNNKLEANYSGLTSFNENQSEHNTTNATLFVFVYDGKNTTTIAANLTFYIKDCLGYFNDSNNMSKFGTYDLKGINITIQYISNITTTGTMLIIRKKSNLGLYIYKITASKNISSNMRASEIRFYYDKNYVQTKNLEETKLAAYIMNNTENHTTWIKANQTGVDIYNNFVYVITEEFTTFLINSTIATNTSQTCKEHWVCKEWRRCKRHDEYQTRHCVDKNHCHTTLHAPITKKKCINKKGRYRPPKKEPDKIKKITTPIISQPKDNGRKVLFDIFMEFPSGSIAYKTLLVKFGLLNFGKPGLVKVNLTYTITNSSGNVVYIEYEKVDVETQVEYLKEFNISKLSPGKYTLNAELKYKSQIEPARSSRDFTIIDKKTTKHNILIVSAIMIVSITMFIFWKFKPNKHKKNIT